MAPRNELDNFPTAGPRVKTTAPHAGNLPAAAGGEVPAVLHAEPLADTHHRLETPEDPSSIIDRGMGPEARFVATSGRLAVNETTQPAETKTGGWFSETKNKAIATAAVLGIVVVGFLGVELTKGSPAKKEATVGDVPVAAGNANPGTTAATQSGIDKETNTAIIRTDKVTIPAVVPQNSGSEGTKTGTTIHSNPEASKLPKLAQKYAINASEAAANPEDYFASLAKSVGMTPGVITEAQAQAFTTEMTDPATGMSKAGEIVSKVQGGNLEAYLNALLVNRNVNLTPTEQAAFDTQFMKYFLVNVPKDKHSTGFELITALRNYVKTAQPDTLAELKIDTYIYDPTDQFMGGRLIPKNSETGTELWQYAQDVKIDMSGSVPQTDPTSNGLAQNGELQLLLG